VSAVFSQMQTHLAPIDVARVVPAMPPGMRLLFTSIARMPGFHPAGVVGLGAAYS
jgi:hypothetical protein